MAESTGTILRLRGDRAGHGVVAMLDVDRGCPCLYSMIPLDQTLLSRDAWAYYNTNLLSDVIEDERIAFASPSAI